MILSLPAPHTLVLPSCILLFYWPIDLDSLCIISLIETIHDLNLKRANSPNAWNEPQDHTIAKERIYPLLVWVCLDFWFLKKKNCQANKNWRYTVKQNQKTEKKKTRRNSLAYKSRRQRKSQRATTRPRRGALVSLPLNTLVETRRGADLLRPDGWDAATPRRFFRATTTEIKAANPAAEAAEYRPMEKQKKKTRVMLYSRSCTSIARAAAAGTHATAQHLSTLTLAARTLRVSISSDSLPTKVLRAPPPPPPPRGQTAADRLHVDAPLAGPAPESGRLSFPSAFYSGGVMRCAWDSWNFQGCPIHRAAIRVRARVRFWNCVGWDVEFSSLTKWESR